MTYIIQKLRNPKDDPAAPADRYTWIEAYGLTEKSWPKGTDDEVIAHFNEVAARARSPRRLVKILGSMGGASVRVLATANFPEAS